ncbi:MAG: hypothetical protein HS111_03260 [Kofleriaceae bacterium]|nr:hypothetical protein [Kofleriaceae bacterium]
MNTAGPPGPWHRLALPAALALATAALALPACQWEVPDDPFIDSGLDAPPGDGGPDAATDAPTDGTPMVRLTVLRTGSATGTVTSNAVDGAMIDCGTTCSASFPPGTLVTLSATPGTGALFAGWAGVCSDAAPSCSFTLDSDTTVQATFDVSRHTVTIIPGGNGLGAVTSNVGGLACPGTCETVVDYGTTLTLTASPTPPSVFAGWNDVACTGTGACTFTVTQDEVIDAAFALNYTITVAKNGNGNGTVTSSPAGITCGADCDQVYPAGTMVTLTATAAADSTFGGWSGACTGTGTCTVQVNAVVAVTATFALRRYTLTTSKAGSTGDGVVTSNPAGITCGGDCEELYDHGTQVTLTATPDATSAFTGWSEATCPGTSACVVTMTGARSVGATFTINRYPLTVVRAGNGAGLGTVTSAPAGITCGADCDELYAAGTMVTLSASAMPGATFMGWSGACTGAGPCVVTMTGAQSVTATFALGQYTLSVSKAGNGASLGTVTSSPAGISCGSTCSAGFQFGQSVTLTPTAASGATFAGWSGGGCSGVGTCVVTIGGDTSVTATFTLESYTLSVVREGNAAAAGLVTSAPSGITCDAATGDCDHTYLFGTSVTLTATAGSGSTFAGWSGGGCAGTGPCAVTIDAARTVTATFTLDEALTVTRLGSGAPYGRVVSSPAGIDCGNDCSENFGVGTMVNLTASATAGAATFTGWGGACSGTQPTCAVTVAAATGVTATFTRASYTLTAARAGDGSGTIESSPAGITCGTDCAESYGYATAVTLTATPDAGSTFTGWSGGGCSGTAACVVSVTAATTVTATFQADRVLTVSTSGNGAGTVTSAPGGISCPGDCAEAYTHGSTVRLTATPTTGSTFTGWSGGGCSGTGVCDVSMTAARSVQATFALTTHTLTVSRAGNGAGTITSTPAGIACGADCTETVTFGATLTLAAEAATGSTFTGWSGGGCSGTDTCVVTVTAATTVTATFEADRTLQVTRAGTGSAYGRVTSSPGGIDCGASCSHAYPFGSLVTMTASVPIAAAATFTGWSGGGCSGAQATCTVPMNQAQSVTATFTIRQHTISVSVGGGNGSGTVSSTPAGINAPADPAEAYPYGTTVTLAATAATGSNFAGWSGVGGCAGVGPCDVLVDGARTVTATFTLQRFTLGVTKTGTSTSLGTVTSSPAGIACGSTCSAQFDHNQAVTLTAATMPGVTFLGWSGAGCSGTGACGVTMTQARSVSAAFEGDKALTVSLGGSGAGTVVSSPPGIMAPGDASEAYAHGTVVTLTAAANTTTSTFTGWSGACTGAQATCDVTMDQARSVTATFTLRTYTLTLDKAGAGVGTVASNPGGINCGTACCTQSAPFSHGQVVSR